MRVAILWIALWVFASLAYAQNDKIIAFPGAEGFGKYSIGGRGGKVYIVTNLNDSGPGSLREALRAKEPRTIVFEVSGTIALQSPVIVRNSNLTIAGQTAPGDGITIANYHLDFVNMKNLIVRYIRFRPGDVSDIEKPAAYGVYMDNAIFDHCSLSWSPDEITSFYGVRNFTLQWSITSEALNNSIHSEGKHGYGAIAGGKNVSWHHNLFAHNTQRMVMFDHPGLYRSEQEIQDWRGITDFRNNVIYNWQDRASSNGAAGTFNLVNNYYKKGPAATGDRADFILNPQRTGSDLTFTYGKFFVQGNILEGNSAVNTDNWVGVRLENPTLHNEFIGQVKVNTPFSVPADIYGFQESAQESYGKVLDFAGASLVRDQVDQRIVQETKTGTFTFLGSKGSTGGIIDSQKDVGGWPVMKSLPAPKDTDRDGMPDAWELENGLNPNFADNNGYKLSSSYTNIEVYINSLVKHISEVDATNPPDVPQLESPVNSATGIATNSILKWKSAANAQTYQLQVSKTQDFGTLISNIENLTSLQHSVQNLELNTQYFWRVRAKNSNGTSSWSSIWNFKTLASLPIPEIPKPISPINGGKDMSNTLFLEWEVVNGAKTYRVQVAKDESFTSILYDIYNLTSPKIEIKNLTSGTPFYWKVLSTNDAGSSSFSNPWTFTTKINTTTETIPVTGISISPTKASLGISKTLQITSTLSPSDASNKTVTWTSSDPTIVRVSSTGLVTGIKSGSVNIIAKSQDGSFTAISQITVSTSVPLGISGFTLVNADTDSDIGTISNGTTVDIYQIKGINLNIRVNTNPTTVGSVSIKLTGPVSETRTENAIPYSLFGDSKGNYNGKILPEGKYILEATPYSEPALAGVKGNFLSIEFTIGQKGIAPTAPKLTSPTNNSTGLPTNPKLYWSAVSNAETYEVEVSKNPDFSSLVVNNNSLTTNEFTVSGLQQDTSYYWRVRAINSAGTSPYSIVWTFRTIKPVLIPAVPSLLSPTNGAKDLSVSPRLQWTSVTGSKTYRVQISKESNFATLFLDNAAVTTNSLQVNGLRDGVTYYWRVRATNESGSSSFSSVWSFQTKQALIPPTAPVLISPYNNATGLATTLKLTWNAVTTATGYFLEVSKNLDFSTLVIDNKTLITNEFTVSGLEEDTFYYWRVRSSNLAGNSPYSSVRTFRTIKPVTIPNIPTLLSPSDAAQEIFIVPKLEWTLVNGAKTYWVQLSKDINFETILLENESLTVNSLKINDLEEGETYYWRVSAGNEAGNSAFSTIWSFKTRISLDPPSVPTLESPSDKDTGLATTLKLTWTIISKADDYAIEISTNQNFSSIISSNFSLTENQFTISDLQEQTQYFWRVRASNSAGVSEWSPIWSFTTKEKIYPPSPPILLTPINESVGLTGKTVFTWTKAEGALVYSIQIAKDPSFSVMAFDLNNIKPESFETNNLEKGATYYWRVFASNEGGKSEFSQVWKFETLGLPEVPVLQSPSNAKKEVETNPKLTWKGVPGADFYRLQISKSKDFSQNIVDNSNLNETFFTIQNLEEGRIYYWRVRATNIAGNSAYSTIWEFTTEKQLKVPTTPVLVSPTSGTLLGVENILLEWKPVTDAEKYQVQVSKFSNFSQAIVFNSNSISTNTITLEGMEPNQVYFWRVRAINLVGNSGYSTVWNFITKPLPNLDLPVLISPVNGAAIDTTSVAFLWEAVGEAENYQFEVSTDSTFKENVKRFPKTVETTFRLDSLESDKIYFWRVIANGKRPSSQSETWRLKVEKNKSLLLSRFSPLQIKTYPNPFTDIILLEFSRPIDGEVNISIFDSKGIAVFESKTSDPKESITLETPQGLPDGIYVIKIQGFGVMESKRVVKN
jgi:predicted phage tail protein